MLNSKLFLSVCVTALVIAGCSKSGDVQSSNNPVIPPVDTTSPAAVAPFVETFESGTKTDYAASSIQLTSGKWSFDNTVVGTSADDKKNGTRSARIRETGKISMNFDIGNAAYSVAVSSAVYGTDAPSTWQLYASYNSGVSYAPVGNIITTSGTMLHTDTIVINAVSKVRFSLRKLSGGSNQVNIDDIKFILDAPVPPASNADDDNMLMGNPSNAAPSVLDFNNYFMDKGYYALSYNRDEGKSNWISWHIKASDFGSTPRQDDFREDVALPSSWYYVSNSSYTGSGFDRGHNCPSEERTASIPANSSTFLMTNICPQAPNINQGPWAKLEDSCKRLVQVGGDELFVICGSYGVGGMGNNGAADDIDGGHIKVPAYLWKVIVVIPNGNNDLSRINNATRVISVIMPNVNTVNSNWKTYRVSVNDIQSATGYDLLSNLPAAVQTVVEQRIDNL